MDVLGFGGAFTQASAEVWQQLSHELQQQVIDAYFDGEKGIGYSIGRVPINSCDFSSKVYNFDDTAGDVKLDHFDGCAPTPCADMAVHWTGMPRA